MVLLFASAYLVSRAGENSLSRLKAQAPNIKRWAGWILMGVGAWLIALAVFSDFFIDLFPV